MSTHQATNKKASHKFFESRSVRYSMSILHYPKEFTLKIPFEIYLCCIFFICTTSVMVEYEPRTRKQGKDFFDLLADPSLKAEKSDEEGKQYPWHRMDCSPSNQSEFRVIWYFTKVTPDGVSENKTVLRDPNENRYLENPSVLRVRHLPGSEGFYSCRIVDSEGNYQEARSDLVFPDYPLMNLYWDNRVILRKSHLYRPVRLVSNTIRLHTNEKYFMSEEIIMHQYASTAMSHLPSNTLMWYSYYDSNKISFMETYPNVPTNAMEIVEGSAIAATVSVLRLELHNTFLKDVKNDSTELKPYEMVLIRAYDPQDSKKSFVKTFHKDEYTCCKPAKNCISCFTVDFYGLSPNRVYNFTTRWVHWQLMGNESIPKTLRTPNSSRRPPSVSKIQVISITGTSLRIAWYPPAHRTSFDIGYLVTVDSGKDERSQQFGPDATYAEFKELYSSNKRRVNISILSTDTNATSQVFILSTPDIAGKVSDSLTAIIKKVALLTESKAKFESRLNEISGSLNEGTKEKGRLKQEVEKLNRSIKDTVVESHGLKSFLIVLETIAIALLLSLLHFTTQKHPLLSRERASDEGTKTVTANKGAVRLRTSR